MSEADEALVLKAQGGDRAAFEELVRRSCRLLHARLYLETGNGNDTVQLDAVQTKGNVIVNTYGGNDKVILGGQDIYDNNFAPVTLKDQGGYENFFDDDHRSGDDHKPFTDDRLPRNFVPFNVQAIGNDLVVTYALHFEGDPFETPGPGLGYVDIYSAKGKLLQRLEHGDWLNAPWGVALAPLDFGRFSHHLLVSNFSAGGTTQSAGFISAYDLDTGEFAGLLEDANGKPISINGIWSISFANSATPNSYDPDEAPAAELYFTAGPNQGTAGLFGYLIPVSTELVQGNSQ